MPKLLDDIVSTKGSEIAVADEFGSTTWSQFDERVRRLINGLKDHGVGPGDTIAMMMGNRRECLKFSKLRSSWCYLCPCKLALGSRRAGLCS